ncbi:MAG: DUF2080 family transposase-associated protein, partial [Methanosarcinaceae archaeon]|nr:DUF2080 family transposase-associated protein [Methanosarcinaceae archaeon]
KKKYIGKRAYVIIIKD